MEEESLPLSLCEYKTEGNTRMHVAWLQRSARGRFLMQEQFILAEHSLLALCACAHADFLVYGREMSPWALHP